MQIPFLCIENICKICNFEGIIAFKLINDEKSEDICLDCYVKKYGKLSINDFRNNCEENKWLFKFPETISKINNGENLNEYLYITIFADNERKISYYKEKINILKNIKRNRKEKINRVIIQEIIYQYEDAIRKLL